MRRYVVSPDLVTTDPKGSVVYNKNTGEVHEVSEETLKLLGVFRKPTDINKALSLVEVDKRDVPVLREFLKDLIMSGLLVTESQAKAKGSPVVLPSVKVQRPARGILSSPVREPDAIDGEDIVFIGSPFDSGATGYPGARFGPNRIRELSSDTFEYHADIFTGKSRGWFSHEVGRNILDTVSMADIGNVLHYTGEGFDAYFDRVREVVWMVQAAGAFPVVIGGDHSVSYATISAFEGQVGVIHIDAHSDLGALIPKIPNNHGNVFTRLSREGLLAHLVQFGVRSFAGETSADQRVVFSSKDLRGGEVEEMMLALKPDLKYFLSLDIDVLDPAFAPGTGTAVPGGITPQELTMLLSALAKKAQFVGCDLVEVNPMLDRNDATSLLAIEMLVHFLGEVFV